MLVDWPSFTIGLVVGFIVGSMAVLVFKCDHFKGDMLLAWTISLTWIVWHLGAGLSLLEGPPPTMYDVVSGGSVGFILGEKFWEGIKFWKK